MYTKLIIALMAVCIGAPALATDTGKDNSLPPGVKLAADIPYGKSPKHKFDVYYPENSSKAPVIFMIHGGAWQGGDKANKGEFENKVSHWVTRGFVLISTNYRTLPELKPVEQIQDIEAAVRFAQQNADKWGGAEDKFIMMGHSSGAHLVALFSANFEQAKKTGIKPWLGTVSLDISGYDIVKKVTGANPSDFYIEYFGKSPRLVEKASPYHVLQTEIPPFMAVCSRRSVDACSQANSFLAKAEKLGGRVALLAVDLSHMEVNGRLGVNSCYTSDVDDFLKILSPEISNLISEQQTPLQKNCDLTRDKYSGVLALATGR